MTQTKHFNDPISGYLEFDEIQLACIDTPQFQRLRHLKQLGAAYYVYQGASHNRFEHSLGTSHIAGNLIERLQKDQPELEIDNHDKMCVKIAALCHDIGHGPFSHVFDGEFIRQALPNRQWCHEEGSQMMVEDLINSNGLSDISTDDLKLIQQLIAGEAPSNSKEKRFLFDIVANKRNSVDVDKFDYISRDCHNVGIKTNYDASRLLQFCRVINDEICFNKNDYQSVVSLFQTRYTLFKTVYTHKTAKAAEYMLVDILLAADKELGISSAIDDPTEYTNLTDSILQEIARSKSMSPGILKAQELLRRLNKRDLYRYIDKSIIPSQLVNTAKDSITAERIVSHSNGYLREEDIIVNWMNLNWSMQDQNPLDSVRFFSKYDLNTSFLTPSEQESLIMPSCFSETTVRIFSRDPEKTPEAQKAFRKLLRELNNEVPMGLVAGSERHEEAAERTTLYNGTNAGSRTPENAGQMPNYTCISRKVLSPNYADTLPECPKQFEEKTSPHKRKRGRPSF